MAWGLFLWQSNMMANLPLIEDFPPFSASVPMKTWIFPTQNPPSRSFISGHPRPLEQSPSAWARSHQWPRCQSRDPQRMFGFMTFMTFMMFMSWANLHQDQTVGQTIATLSGKQSGSSMMKDGHLCQVDDGVRSLEGWTFHEETVLSMAFPRSVAPFWFFTVGVLVFCLSSSIPFCQSFLCSVCFFRNWNYVLFSAYNLLLTMTITVIVSKTSIKIFRFEIFYLFLSKLIMAHPIRGSHGFQVCTPATGGSTGLYDCRVTPSVSGDRLMSGAWSRSSWSSSSSSSWEMSHL